MSKPREGKSRSNASRGKEAHMLVVDRMLKGLFPVKLHRWIDHRGENLIYEESERGIVKEIAGARLEADIAAYWRSLQDADIGVPLPVLGADDATKVRKLWLVLAPAHREPFPLLTWASDWRPAYHKAPFDPKARDDVKPTPLFDALIARISNGATLMAWIGGIFDEKSQRQQYIWIYGGGGDGKGALIRALERAMAPVMQNEEPPARDSKHWTWGLVGKRLIVFADCNNASFVNSGLFKSLTGEDRIRVEIKGGAILSMDLAAKYLFTSNNRPRIPGTKANTRRIIYCEITPTEHFDPSYEDQLADELHDFLSKCWHAHLDATHGNPRRFYSPETEKVNELVAETENEYAAFVEDYLAFDRDENGKLSSVVSAKHRVLRSGDMKSLMTHAGFKTEHERHLLREYLLARHGISPTVKWVEMENVRNESKSVRGYHGVLGQHISSAPNKSEAAPNKVES